LNGKRKVEVFENPTGPATVSYEIGNKMTATDTVIWAPQFEDPILSLFDYDELFPQDASKIIEIPAEPAKTADNNLAKDTPNGASSAAGKTKIMKLEKTVNSPKDLKKLPAPLVEKGAKYTAPIIFKNGRKLKVELAADKAPYTVSNFIHLARNGFFDGVIFHRVIKDFVAQGGDPTGTGRGGPGWMFDNEDNDLKHVKGSLSMAHAGRNTNGSQFFIVLAPQPHLDGLHTVYGQVTDGINEIDQIKQGDAMQTVEIYEEK
jgi:peptidyl-prolyl cis-trans isomerase B (cyclophilin B)